MHVLIFFWTIPYPHVTGISTGFPGVSDGKASAGNARDLGSIPGSGRSPGKRNSNHSSTLAWKIPWTEEPGRLQSMELQSRTRLSNFTSLV